MPVCLRSNMWGSRWLGLDWIFFGHVYRVLDQQAFRKIGLIAIKHPASLPCGSFSGSTHKIFRNRRSAEDSYLRIAKLEKKAPT
jgi:hypothetical protein